MNRIIKFRCWDAAHKEFNRTCAANILLQLHEPTEDLDPEYGTRFTLSQFTGLLDKNGKEIFEGDVIKTHVGNIPVTFERGCFYISFNGSNYRLGGWQREIEVVGNIYESFDALKPKI